ncbi:MAG: glycosyltransferase, partial [Thermovirgaceae bacterium]|nr:glycosyltransferase [Thermovirgaceae bacterium]
LGGPKVYDTLLKAFSILRKNRPAKLFIMGGGRQKERLETLAKTLQIDGDVEFAGFMSNPFPYLSNSDLYILSSRYEGFGMALLEALALGIPSVATDCPSGPREILQEGRFGELIPIADVNAMAEAMVRTLDGPHASHFLKQAATPYSIDNVADDYLKLLGLDHVAS